MANYARKYGLAGWAGAAQQGWRPTTPAPVSCAAPARSVAPTACPSATCWSGGQGAGYWNMGRWDMGWDIAGHVRPSAGLMACPYRPGRLAQTAQVGARIRRGLGPPFCCGPCGRACISSRVRPLTRRMPFYGQNRKFFYLPQATNACSVPSPVRSAPSCTPEPLEPEPEGPAGSYPAPAAGASIFLVPKEKAIAWHLPGVLLENDACSRTRTPPAMKTGNDPAAGREKLLGNGGRAGGSRPPCPPPRPGEQPCKPLNKGEPHVCSTIFSSKARGRTT